GPAGVRVGFATALPGTDGAWRRPRARPNRRSDMTTITESVEVAVPVRTAYNQWTQFEEFPRFMGGVAEVRQLSDTRTHWVTTVGGVTREFDAEITEQVPDRRVAWESISGARQAGTVDIEPVAADRSRVTVRMEYEPQRFTEKVADAMGLLRRQVRRDLDRFRDFIEERGTETGGWRGEVRGDEPPDDARTW